MTFVILEHAHTGMVLAADVRDLRGRLLVPAGQELTERHVDALRMWGVEGIEVEGVRVSGEPERGLCPKAMANAVIEVDRLLGPAGAHHPFLEQVRGYAVHRKAVALARASGEGS